MRTIQSDFLTLVTRLILVKVSIRFDIEVHVSSFSETCKYTYSEVWKQLAKGEYFASTTNEPRYILRVASQVYEMSFERVT